MTTEQRFGLEWGIPESLDIVGDEQEGFKFCGRTFYQNVELRVTAADLLDKSILEGAQELILQVKVRDQGQDSRYFYNVYLDLTHDDARQIDLDNGFATPVIKQSVLRVDATSLYEASEIIIRVYIQNRDAEPQSTSENLGVCFSDLKLIISYVEGSSSDNSIDF